MYTYEQERDFVPDILKGGSVCIPGLTREAGRVFTLLTTHFCS